MKEHHWNSEVACKNKFRGVQNRAIALKPRRSPNLFAPTPSLLCDLRAIPLTVVPALKPRRSPNLFAPTPFPLCDLRAIISSPHGRSRTGAATFTHPPKGGWAERSSALSSSRS
jgi:hypothetical protein